MKYMLLMYWDQSKTYQSTPEEYQAAAQAWAAFGKEAAAAGVLLSTNGLASATAATTVRVQNGKTLTTQGPAVETREQLSGCYLLECKDLDEAIGWAAKIPAAQDGAVEVRPLWSPG
ncbi:MAG: YciI family protein [Anaerolineae bacterium]